MTDATQNSDSLTLAESLAAMKRLGTLAEYRIGYEHGFLNLPYDFGRGLAYARGRSAGLDAWGRGAHGSDAPVSAAPWVPSRDGAL